MLFLYFNYNEILLYELLMKKYNKKIIDLIVFISYFLIYILKY